MLKLLVYIILVLYLMSCSSSRKERKLETCDIVAHSCINHDNSLLVADVGKARQRITISLSELVSDWRLIKLENTSKEMMVSTVCRIYLSENYLIVSNIDNNVLLFNGEGKFQRKVGRVGNGPADILPGVITVQIDEKREKIYLTDSQMRKMKMYCLSDASYIGAIPLSFQAITPSYMVNSQDSTILITHVPMNDSPAVLWKQDFQGNVLSSIVPKRFENPKGFWMLGTDAFYMWKNKDKITLAILHNPATNDSLYHYNESTNEVHPYFAVNFPGDAPDHWIYETSDFYMITINGSTGGDISSGYHNRPQQRIIIDKKTGRGAYANIVLDGYGNIPITKQRFYMWGEYFTLTLSPEWVAEMAEKALAHPEYLKPGEKERLQTLVDSITEEDNTFIVYGKIK